MLRCSVRAADHRQPHQGHQGRPGAVGRRQAARRQPAFCCRVGTRQDLRCDLEARSHLHAGRQTLDEDGHGAKLRLCACPPHGIVIGPALYLANPAFAGDAEVAGLPWRLAGNDRFQSDHRPAMAPIASRPEVRAVMDWLGAHERDVDEAPMRKAFRDTIRRPGPPPPACDLARARADRAGPRPEKGTPGRPRQPSCHGRGRVPEGRVLARGPAADRPALGLSETGAFAGRGPAHSRERGETSGTPAGTRTRRGARSRMAARPRAGGQPPGQGHGGLPARTQGQLLDPAGGPVRGDDRGHRPGTRGACAGAPTQVPWLQVVVRDGALISSSESSPGGNRRAG